MSGSHEIERVFALPESRHAKDTAALIEQDEKHLVRVATALSRALAQTQERLDAVRREPAGTGQRALERDLEVQRLSRRVRVLGRFGIDACIGRMVDLEGRSIYIGRFGLAGDDEERLLVDWRAPAAEPFFAATAAHPMGLSWRRRYRWNGAHIVDYGDEVFAPDGLDHTAALDDQSAFIASLGATRSARMRDVLATIQTDQDAIIRAGSARPLVVDGGPGTGKTVVALHRAAYLLYAEARLHHGGLLFVGPHRPYVDYVDDVLPSLGEDGALVCAIGDLVAGGADAPVELDTEVRRVKGLRATADAVDAAVGLWQRPPQRTIIVDTAWGGVPVTAPEWAEIFDPGDGAPHNAVRALAWDRLLDLLAENVERLPGAGEERWTDGWGEASREPSDEFDAYGSGWDADEPVRETLENDDELHALFDGLWPLLDPEALLRGLLGSDRMLRRCAPALSASERDALTRAASARWTDVDLPLLDAALWAVGDPRAQAQDARERREAASVHRTMSDVVTDLIAADDGDLRIMSMLRGQDLRRTLARTDAERVDPLAGPFAHIVVDEAQELTPAQWRMLVRRCPSASLTIVGDRAQARQGPGESWIERLAAVGIERATVSTLTVSYRTPEEVMDVAAPVIRAVVPDANVPTSIRRTGVPVERGARSDLDAVLDAWERRHPEGIGVVIGDPAFAGRDRIRSLAPELVKGLEFDLVVLVDPERFGDGVSGAVDTYVAMTRATQRLVILRSEGATAS